MERKKDFILVWELLVCGEDDLGIFEFDLAGDSDVVFGLGFGRDGESFDLALCVAEEEEEEAGRLLSLNRDCE